MRYAILTLPLWIYIGACTASGAGASSVNGAPDAERADESGLLPIPPEGLSFRSEYSHIVLREKGSLRTLYFRDDEGIERIESQMNVRKPEQLQVAYTRSMFVSYLFVPEPKRVMLIGIGAGSMVRFLQHYEPRLTVDAVDIDPVVVRVAADYFGTREDEDVHLIVDDGFHYLETTEHQYDVIYLDAFLKPSTDTDSTGVPLRLKTIETYRRMQTRLTPHGVVVVNLHHPTLEADVEQLRNAFSRGHLFRVPGAGNYILVGTRAEHDVDPTLLAEVGQQADARLRTHFSIASLAVDLDPR